MSYRNKDAEVLREVSLRYFTDLRFCDPESGSVFCHFGANLIVPNQSTQFLFNKIEHTCTLFLLYVLFSLRYFTSVESDRSWLKKFSSVLCPPNTYFPK
jgi:hypothetical protein